MNHYTMDEEQFKVLVKSHTAIIQAGESLRHLVCSLIPPDENRNSQNVKQLKAKIASSGKKLNKYNYYGSKYHIREIDEIVKELQQLSAI